MGESQHPEHEAQKTEGQSEAGKLMPGAAVFRALAHRSPDPMLLLRLTGEIVGSNEAFSRLIGFRTEQLEAMLFNDLIHPDDRPQYDALAKDLSDGSPAFDVVLRMLSADGQPVQVRISITLAREPGGYSIVALVQDGPAREDEQRMRMLADHSSEYIAIADDEGRISYLNRAGRELLGLEAEEDPGTCMDHLSPEEGRRMKDLIWPQLERSGYWEGESTLQHRLTAEHIPIELKLLQIKDPQSGKALGRAAIAHDLRPELAARDALREREERLRSALELARLGTWSIELDEGMISYSDRVRELYGLPPGPVPVRSMKGIHPEDRARHFTDMEKALRDAEGFYDSEHRTLNETTGEVRYLHSQGRVLKDSSGKPFLIIGTVQDITEQKLARHALEQQVESNNEELYKANQQLQDLNSFLQQSNAELEQYAYVASHDLQEPLRKITVFAGMLAKMQHLPPEVKSTVEKISQASTRMTQLIRDLLDFSRLLKVEQAMRPVDLNEVIKAVLADFELQITDKKADIECDSLPTVDAIGLQMNQLFYNLISNALKFTRKDVQPKIVIRCRKLDEGEHAVHGLHDSRVVYYFITVSDNGIGFNSLYAEQIFEVFKRLHTRQAYPGSGIGLALCRRILQNHGGIVTAHSSEGVGTTISMILPSKQTRESWHRPG